MLRPVVTIDASSTVAEALEILEQTVAEQMVVVRRSGPEGLLWYALQPDDVRSTLAAFGPEESVATALDLHEHGAQDARQITDRDVRGRRWEGIVLDGAVVVGYALAEASRVTRGGVFADTADRVAVDEPGEAAADAVNAYPRLDGPGWVESGSRFELVVGLSREAHGDIQGGPLTIRTAAPTFELTMQVVADRFEFPEGIRRTVVVDRDDLDAAFAIVPLIAPAIDERWQGVIEVEYAVGGVPVGRAWRTTTVSPAPVAVTPAVGRLPLDLSGPPAPDLTVTITDGETAGDLLWTFTTPHDVTIPDHQVSSRLPLASAQAFALEQVKDVARVDGTSVAENRIKGIARAVASAAPVEMWQVLTAMWRLVADAGRTPTVLLISSDAYVPWELASVESDWVVDRSLVDEALPPVLGAHLRIGRWLPAGPRTPAGIERPAVPPAAAVDVGRMAVVVGDYKAETGVRPLPKAKEEGRALSDRYRAVWINGTLDEVDRLLDCTLSERGDPVAVDLVHFACHGEVDPANPAYNGIVLSDTALRLDPTIVRGSELGRETAPFVFLNACQLAQTTTDLLCDYGGLAGAFLTEGCRGFLAPLWSVDDGLAHDIAIEFYRLVLDEGVPVGEAIRAVRGAFFDTPEHTQTTPLAYVFYGHPELAMAMTGDG